MRKLLAVFLFLFPVFAIGIVNVTTDRPYYAPGDSGYLLVSMSFTHPLPSTRILVDFSSAVLHVAGPFDMPSEIYIGDVSPGTVMFQVPFTVPKNVEEKTYLVSLKVSAYLNYEENYVKKSQLVSSSSVAVIKVARKPKIMVSATTSRVGRRTNFTLTICSEGGEAKDITLIPNKPFVTLPDKIYIPYLEGCNNVSFILDSSEAEDGSQSLSFNITYKNKIGDSITSKGVIPLVVDKTPKGFAFTITPLVSEKEVGANITVVSEKQVENFRVRPLKDVLFSELPLNFGMFSGKKSIFTYAYTRLPPGVYTIPLEIKWIENGAERSDVAYVSVKVEPQDNVGILLESKEYPLKVGKNTTIIVTASNGGSAKITSAYVVLSCEGCEILELENKKFIGSIEADDFTTERFTILPLRENVTLAVKLIYKDKLGDERLIEKKVFITARKEWNYFWVLLVAPIIVVMIYVVRRILH